MGLDNRKKPSYISTQNTEDYETLFFQTSFGPNGNSSAAQRPLIFALRTTRNIEQIQSH